jgi:hypothetical protein
VPERAQVPVWGQVPELAWALEQVSAQGWVPVSAPALVRGQARAPGRELVPEPAQEPARGWEREPQQGLVSAQGPALVPGRARELAWVLAQVPARAQA